MVGVRPRRRRIGDGVDVGGQIVNGAPEAVVVVSRSGTLGSWEGTPRGGARWRCGYYAFDYGSGDFGLGLAKVHYDDGPVDPEPGQPYVLACFDPSDRMVSSILRIYDPADPFGGVAATERALDEARRRLDLPLPQPALNPPTAQLVGVPTWLWVDGPWAPASATAAVGHGRRDRHRHTGRGRVGHRRRLHHHLRRRHPLRPHPAARRPAQRVHPRLHPHLGRPTRLAPTP